MIPKRIILQILLIVTISSCSTESNIESKIPVIEINLDGGSSYNRKCDELTKSAEIIKLDLPGSIKQVSIKKVINTQHHYLIQDIHNNVVWVFNKSGNIVKKIDPQHLDSHYLEEVTDIALLDSAHFALFDGAIGEVCICDFTGKVKNKIKVPLSDAEFQVIDESKLLFLKGRYNLNNSASHYQLIVTDIYGNIEDKYLPYDNFFSDWLTCGFQISKNKDNIYVNPTFERTIYRYNIGGEFSPAYQVNFTNRILDTSNISVVHQTKFIRNNPKNFDKPLSCGSMFPSTNGLFMWNMFNKKGVLIYFDFESYRVKVIKAQNHLYLGSYHGLIIPKPIGIVENKLIGCYFGRLENIEDYAKNPKISLPENIFPADSNISLYLVFYTINL